MALIQALKGFEVLADLSDDDLSKLEAIADPRDFDANGAIFEEKAGAEHLFLLQEGSVELTMTRARDNEPITTDTIGPGEVFGWSALTEPAEYTARAAAREKTRTLALHGGRLRALFEANPAIGYSVMSRLAPVIGRRLRGLRQKFIAVPTATWA